jgi:NADPH-dependent 2,4-dienoyl-CoA reductase/sulfur reductase-like enzyme
MKAIPTRRTMLRGVAGAAAGMLCTPAIAQAAPRVVVIGGGFAGASCARALRQLDQGIKVTLVEARRTYTVLPLSNGVLGGLRDLAAQQFGYDKIAASGVAMVFASATAVDTKARTVGLSSGGMLGYDRLVVAPGIDFRWDALPGYNEAAAARMPHAWTTDGAQLALLHRQLEAMEDGGVVAITAPANPARCPPGPYERASMIAHYLQTKKPRSKLFVLDAKDTFTMQRLFQAGWKKFYPGLLEWVGVSGGGNPNSVDVASMTIETDFDKYKCAVANVIPPQKAGQLATIAGVADRTGWCPIDPASFESLLQANVHVIGDAAIAGAMPKSAFAGSVEGKLCAAAILRLLGGKTPDEPKLISNCYSLIAPDYAISIAGVYHPVKGDYLEVDGAGGTSPADAPASFRAQEAKFADVWFKTATNEIFG